MLTLAPYLYVMCLDMYHNVLHAYQLVLCGNSEFFGSV